jgi:hypothetical protein
MARTYNNKESNVTLVPRNDRGEYIKVARLVPEGNQLESIDIRNHYTSDQDGKVYPTQKGVRIHSEMLVETVVAILNALRPDELEDVLAQGLELKAGEEDES